MTEITKKLGESVLLSSTQYEEEALRLEKLWRKMDGGVLASVQISQAATMYATLALLARAREDDALIKG